MRSKYFKGIIFLSLLLLCGLYFVYKARSIPGKVNSTLNIAGANKAELLKVIEHYKKQGNKKKLSAAYFLLENMQDMYHHEGNPVREYQKFFNTIDSLSIIDRSFSRKWDSLIKIYSPKKLGKATIVKDVSSLKADLLIQHIDAAFEAWNYPWAKQLSFAEFCEYILPYKVADENQELWIKKIQQKNKWLLDSMQNSTSLLDASLYLNKTLKQNFWINSLFNSTWDFNYSDLDKVFSKIHTRGCFYSTQYSTYVLRSMGLPVAIDFTPYWANSNNGHEWNALISESNKPIPFIGTESDPGKTKVEAAFSRKRAKVFRRTFSVQEGHPFTITRDTTEVPELFRNAHLRDVTSHYMPVSTIDIKLDREASASSIAYLCVYNRKDWKPVCWGRINKEGYGDFKDMGRDIAYLPTFCEEGELYPAGAPFILRRSGAVDILVADKKKPITITVISKSFDGVKITPDKEYELLYWDPMSSWTSLGKKKATSNYLQFENVPANALYIIHSDDKPETERIFTYENGEQKFW